MLSKTFSFIKHFIAPPFCLSCKNFLDYDLVLCDPCARQIRPIVSKTLEISSTKRIQVYAVGAYDRPLVPLILAKSYGNRTTAHQLGTLIWDYTVVSHVPFDYIVPIPLHWTRYAWRGYNQADEIARIVADRSGKPVENILMRSRRTKYQSFFKGADRLTNVADIFTIAAKDSERYKDKHLLLVDDVMTSGATVKEAAKLLYELKPASISAVVVARVG